MPGGTEVGSLYYDLDLKDDRLNSALDRTDKQVSSLGDRMSQSWGRSVDASRKFALGVAAVGLAVGAATAKFVIWNGVTRALNIEDAQAKLRGLGHDAKTVELVMNSALKSVKGTAFGLDAAATAAASAVAAGVKPGQDLTRVLSLTGDAATIMGREFGEAGSIINKVLASNKLSMEEVNQLHDAGLPILSLLAKQYGVTAEAMREMVTDGKVGSAEFLKAIETNIGGAALKSGNTTRGAWENMQAAMARVGEKIVKDIIPKVRDAFNSITKWFDDNSEKIVSVAGKIGDAIGKFFGMIPTDSTSITIIAGAIMGALVPAMIALGASVWTALAPLIPFMLLGAAIALGIKMLVEHFGGLDGTMKALAPTINAFKAVWQAMVTIWSTMVLPVLKLIWAEFVNNLLPALQRLWNQISPVLLPALKALGIIIGVTLVGFIMATLAVLYVLIKVFANVVSFISSMVNAIRNAITWFSNLRSSINNVVNGAAGWLVSAGVAMIRGLVNGITSQAGAVGNAVMNIAKGALNAVKSFFGIKSPSTVMAGVGDNLMAGLEEGIEKSTRSVVNTAMAASADVLKGFTGDPTLNLATNGQTQPAGNTNAFTTNGSSTPRGGDTIVNIGTIEDRQDADYILRRIDRGSQLESMGLSTP